MLAPNPSPDKISGAGYRAGTSVVVRVTGRYRLFSINTRPLYVPLLEVYMMVCTGHGLYPDHGRLKAFEDLKTI